MFHVDMAQGNIGHTALVNTIIILIVVVDVYHYSYCPYHKIL